MRKNKVLQACLHLGPATTKDTLKTFHTMDADGDNRVSWEEFKVWLE